ncbi:hypothetical protein DPMN_091206 [Dreissena polymorpha]|uniref:Uncharacterized protein n=1 Tax=Dreissena polymorpha TaxID=45954 RepID=A0A9D4KZZ6_DREPO|nr:hypothetical protein DPMN_091206 [Dreissena polymorpha]
MNVVANFAAESKRFRCPARQLSGREDHNSAGACDCTGDYDPLTNCSLSRSQKPTLSGLSGGGLKDGKCDRKKTGCNAFTIATSGSNVTTKRSNPVHYDVSALTVTLRLLEQRVGLKSHESASTCTISVSNDGSTYSDSASSVNIILDSTCITSDGTIFVLAFRPGPISRMRHFPCTLTSRRLPCTLTSRRLPCTLTRRRLPCTLTSRRLPCTLTSRRLPCTLTSRRLPYTLKSRRVPALLSVLGALTCIGLKTVKDCGDSGA